MTATAKVTSKGQITLPKEVRRMLDVREGSVVVFEKEDDRLVIRSARTLREFRGVLRGKTANFEEMRTLAKKHVGEKASRGRR